MSDTEAIEEVGSGYNHEYELLEQEKVVWVSDGHFIDQSWVSLGESTPVRPLHTDKVYVLSTWLRHEDGELKGESYAHDRHPFVVFLHLLDKAEANSTVFLSIPFLSDFDAIDQLCYYADPQNGGLTINVILGPAITNIVNLENFVGRSQTREEAVGKLHVQIWTGRLGENNVILTFKGNGFDRWRNDRILQLHCRFAETSLGDWDFHSTKL